MEPKIHLCIYLKENLFTLTSERTNSEGVVTSVIIYYHRCRDYLIILFNNAYYF